MSSQIEGTQSSLSDLLLFEITEMPGAPTDDVVEVSNYVRALEHGLKRLNEDFPLSNRLIREIHGQLLSRGRGFDKSPGEFRRSQVWIGGTRPGTAPFRPGASTGGPRLHGKSRTVPPPGRSLSSGFGPGRNHSRTVRDGPSVLGWQRTSGEVAITLMLVHDGILKQPLLYLSLYFKQNRATYYSLLDEVRQTGDWERWLRFFLDGVAETANGAVATAQRLMTLFDQHEQHIGEGARATGSALEGPSSTQGTTNHFADTDLHPHRPLLSRFVRRYGVAARPGDRHGAYGPAAQPGLWL